eukprot:CAMPEP_0173187618 /NCGR_PEP_ID=MMETSP1141-20130122/10810_1 /TAXON_ID=483371 /ORGANISM="non described non described, Strain CCMP2298" /LENGTH=439 /DNA_ID=CAMNT_0014111477 /DNA_START=153 /DNA_END=1469 /DNA_ORIENTATION=+
MNLIRKQDEFSDLLSVASIDKRSLLEEAFKNLPERHRLKVASSWLSDGIHARHIDYPQTVREVLLFRLSRSPYLRMAYNISAVTQIALTFFDVAQCDYQYETGHNALFRDNGAPTRMCLTILDLLFLGVFGFDLFLKYSINPTKKSLQNKPWSTFRLAICLFVLIDCCVFFLQPTSPRLMRCVFPFLLISRRNNLKLMAQGLLVSAYKALPVVKALVSLLIVWGFVGFLYFRDTDNDNAFSNPAEGTATALHCFTSRPYVLKALNTIYPNNQASALYFVGLSLAADVLCISLIVAVGAKHYKQFAGYILHARLVDRRHALECAFIAVRTASMQNSANTNIERGGVENFGDNTEKQSRDSDTVDAYVDADADADTGMGVGADAGVAVGVSYDTWVLLCSHVTGKYATSPYTAGFIFDFAVSNDPRQDRGDRGGVDGNEGG